MNYYIKLCGILFALQRRTAVIAYLKSKQLLLFAFVRQVGIKLAVHNLTYVLIVWVIYITLSPRFPCSPLGPPAPAKPWNGK